MPQESGVDREATGRENLLLQGRIQGMRGAALRARAGELLESLGIAAAADRPARTYSGGMRRRLDVALGLVHRPRVLFLDEPTTGLDPEARAALWEELERLARDEALTILLTTHYLEEADRLAGRLVIVSRGTVVEGAPEALKQALKGDSVTVESRTGPTGHGRGRPWRRCPRCARQLSTAGRCERGSITAPARWRESCRRRTPPQRRSTR